MNQLMLLVETVYDRRSGRIRLHPLPGQRARTQDGREIDVNPTLWVQFPRHLRTAAGLRFACERLVLIAGGGRRPFFHASGTIQPATSNGVHASPIARLPTPAGEVLHPVRPLRIVAARDEIPAAHARTPAPRPLRIVGVQTEQR